MKKFIILLFLGLICSSHLFSQNSYIPTIVPKAPDAAALMKFSDIPVSPYTGASSVTVPIYTIKVKGVTIPVSVDYHTGGIKVEEEASSTGIGWALTAGRMISRTINDKDDLGGLYFGNTIPQIEGDLTPYQPSNGNPITSDYANLDSLLYYQCPTCSAFINCPGCPVNGNRYMFEFQCSYNVNFYKGTGNYMNDFGATGSDHPYDEEPDTYSFNFLGKSGKFIIGRDKKTIVLEKQDNIKIQFINPDGPDYYFLITDEEGNKYYFHQTQASFPTWKPSGFPTSWYLTTIITQQNDEVDFVYRAGATIQVASEKTQTYSAFGQYQGMQESTNTGTTYNDVILDTIKYPDGCLKFYSSSGRTDLTGGSKLDSIRVYSKTTAGLKYLKSHKFYYSYFNPGSTLEDQRLRLDSVKEFSGGNSIRPYSFAYNAAPPTTNGAKHGYNIDHWGYYNGAGNSVFIPTSSTYYIGNNYNFPPTEFTYTGANREPSFPNSQCMSLRRVNYPTGGSSIFTYEANTYDYNKSLSQNLEYPQQVLVAGDTLIHIQQSSFTGGNASGAIDFSKIYPVIGAGITGYNATIIVTFVSTHITGWTPAQRAGFNNLQFNFKGNITDLSNSSLSCSGPQCNLSYQYTVAQASSTFYTWTAHWNSANILPADFSEIEIRVTFNELKTVAQSNPTLTAGGLRIKSIVDSTVTGIAKKRTWNYHYGSTNQYSNGILMSFPSYVRMEEQRAPDNGNIPVLVLFGSSYTNASSAIGGNIVGYSHVTETTVDPSSGVDIGKTVYSFVNTADTVIGYSGLRYPGIPNMGNNLNGSEISRITYRNNAGNYWKLAETDNYYHTTNRKVYYSAKYRTAVMVNQSGSCNIPGGSNVEDQGIAEFFPSIKSERVLQDSTRNYVYNPADTTKFLLTSTKNFYDDTAHYLVTRTRMVDSKGNAHVTKITYPQDYRISYNHTGNAILDSLIAHNMVAETIEKRDSLYYPSVAGNVISATENRYKQLTSTGKPMVQDKVYRLDITKPVNDFVPVSVSGATYNQDSRYRQLISFDTYDSKSNIAQYTLTNELPVSIIWDYRQMSPIAQVKNGGLADIAYTSFEAEGTGNWTVGSATRDSTTATITGYKSYNLALGNISKSGLTSGTTYVVSYWTKNASPLTITGTITGYPLKGATIKGWTYYEHKITGLTTVTLTGTGSIDEIRLYPQNAQMTSYTYSPQVGVTTISDARGGISYYEYDGFQRLMNIKDQNGNIIKSFDYHYANH